MKSREFPGGKRSPPGDSGGVPPGNPLDMDISAARKTVPRSVPQTTPSVTPLARLTFVSQINNFKRHFLDVE